MFELPYKFFKDLFPVDFSDTMPRLQPFSVGQVFNESLYRQVHVLGPAGGGQTPVTRTPKTSVMGLTAPALGPISLP